MPGFGVHRASDRMPEDQRCKSGVVFEQTMSVPVTIRMVRGIFYGGI